MDKAIFKENFDKVEKKIDINAMDKLLTENLTTEVENIKGARNLVIVMEEFAECIQQVSKVLRGKTDRYALLEETADALIGIRYIQLVCDISDEDLSRAVNVKLKRLKERYKREKEEYLTK